jgi:hypothetical protein
MRRYLRFSPVFILLFLVSCQKEASFEQGKPSRGSLQNSAGDCLAKTVAGTYKAGQALGDTNFIEVNVDVTQTGRYTVYTDTVNGYYFRATGNFTATGPATVQMKGFGTPGSAGINGFTVYYDSSFCAVSVTVLPGGGSSGGTATYTLNGSGGNCLNFTPAGTFTQGVALTSANKVTLEVNVTKVGTWSITTAPVAGFSFSGSGTFANTGVQTITLTASGTPTASGAQVFPVTAGSTSCSFTITVDAGSNPPPSGDYFPRTTNSNWSYTVDDDPNDTLLRVVLSQTHSALNNTYNIFAITDDASQGFDSSGYYRKSGGNYYEWVDATGDLGFDNEQWIEYIFLKDDQPVNTTWYSPTINGTAGGNTYVLRNKFTILQKDVTVTVQGKAYANTIVVEERIEQNAGATWVDISSTVGVIKTYYAKGVGMIKWELTDPSGTTKLELTRSQVL